MASSAQPTVAPPPGQPALRRPELLAPAGDWDCVRAAVENGADAIYFGLERFNARMRAKNFTVADLPALMTFLHRDRKSTRLNSSHIPLSRMPSSA